MTVPLLQLIRREVVAVLAVLLTVGHLDALVISEIHYHPRGGNDALEFVEISNESATPEDISGYHFSNGIVFQFGPGTILGKGESIVVCADVAAVRDRYGIDNAVGNFFGRLDNRGERLTLANQVGIEVASVRYRDEGKWPTACDGTGHTLMLRDMKLDASEPESWMWSPQLGGSPGRLEEDDGPGGVEELVLLDTGDEWRFARGTEPFAPGGTPWWSPEFDDASWDAGPAGFGFADGDDETVLDDMRNGYSTVACRASFELTADDVAAGDVTLSMLYDDGFCAYLNGTRFAEANCPDDVGHDSLATGGHEANDEETFAAPSELLVAGVNVIAIVGLNVTIDSTDFSLGPRVLLQRRDPPAGSSDGRPVFNELHRSVAQDSWIELFNPSSQGVNLEGFTIATDPGGVDAYAIPAGTALAAGGFLAITDAVSGLDLLVPEVRIFLSNPRGLVVAAATFDRTLPPEREGEDYSEALFPDGGSIHWVTLTDTRAAPNRVDAVTDVVINELFYHPPEDRRGEFIELFHRGADAIDLSGYRFSKGVGYTFPPGTTLEAGEYLVIADDPTLVEEQHGISGVLGPFEGQLSNEGENVRLVDAWGNLVDEVRYFDGGTWALSADGRGSSLELIDPAQNNEVGLAWGGSDESNKSRWERLSYTVDDYRPASQSELHLLLVERGSCLIDEVSVRRAGGSNRIPNAGFETSTSGWRIEGTHQDSRRVTWDARAGSACLELNASGKGDTSVNRIEIDTSPALTRGSYEVSLWARWLGGASVIVGHGEFSAGPWGGRPGPSTNLSGNTLGGRMRMTVPQNLGTPGAENSLRRLLIAATGSGNLGPVIWDVSHSPAAPDETVAVEIAARVADSDGIAAVRAFYRERDAGGAFDSIGLTPTGDGSSEDGRYAGQLPTFPRSRKVVFFIEATDRTGIARRFPLDAPDRTQLFQVLAPQGGSLDAVSLVVDDARHDELRTRRLHSNHLIDAAYVFNDEDIHYNVGIRYRGSPWGRPGRNSYRVRFTKDNVSRWGVRAVNLSSRLNGPVEAASYFLTGRAGTPEKPASVPMYRFVRSRLNGSSLGMQRFIQPVDRDYMETWFPGSDGPLLKAVARLAFNDSGERTHYDGASFDYMEESPENYRFYYYQVTSRSRDDWTSLAELMRVMDPRETGNAEHDVQIGEILDVEGFLRVMVPRVFVSDWDTLGIGQGHNAYLAFDTRDGLWETMPYDYNQAMPSSQLNFPVFPTFDRGWARLISRPQTRRVYVRIASEFLAGYWSTETAGPWFDAMQRDLGISMGEPRSFVSSRGRIIEGQLRSFSEVPFRIRTNGGDDITVDESTIVLEGEAPVEIATILYSQSSGENVELLPTWETPNRWQARFTVPIRNNEFSFLGFDGSGGLVATAAITVTNTSVEDSGFTRGDANGDQSVDLSDAVRVILHLFGGRGIDCADAADVDDNGRLDSSDAIGLLDYLFRSGEAPRPPFPGRGDDATADPLGCER